MRQDAESHDTPWELACEFVARIAHHPCISLGCVYSAWNGWIVILSQCLEPHRSLSQPHGANSTKPPTRTPISTFDQRLDILTAAGHIRAWLIPAMLVAIT